jgi:hypothetical protein
MKLRDTIQFTTDLPDGQVDSEDGTEILVYGGRPAAEAIQEVLGDLGCQSDPIVSVEFKGWEFDFRYRNRPLWCRVSIIDRHIAYFDDKSFWSKLTGARHPIYAELLARVNDALAADTRFHDVRWYALKEIETDFEGALQPVS